MYSSTAITNEEISTFPDHYVNVNDPPSEDKILSNKLIISEKESVPKVKSIVEEMEVTSAVITADETKIEAVNKSCDIIINDGESSLILTTTQTKEEKILKRQEERESKKIAEEEYNRELSEQRYKRLMHLLDKSQFYANLILGKKQGIPTQLSQSVSPLKKKKGIKRKQSGNIPKENSPPVKRPRRNVRPREEHDFKDFVTSNITRRLRDRKSLKKIYSQVDDESLEFHENKEDNSSSLDITVDELLPVADADDDNNNGIVCPTPKYFVGELRDYQIDGLKWLKILHENGLNGILADEMGLGKTIQVIALFCHLIENRQGGPFLVVAPLSTIPNWLMEFDRFSPCLPVVLLHGNPEEKLKSQRKIKQKYLIENEYKTQPIVITTYEVALKEKNFFKSQQWRYIVIDEGQRIKNHECQLVKALKSLKSMNRLLLTGTPLQNNLAELWSLLNFLLPEVFNDLAVFESWFDAKELQHEQGTMKFLQQEEEKKVVASLREILKPFMLRRVKSDVCLDIPLKKEIIVYAPITELQRDLYKAVLNRDLQTLCKIEESPLIIDVEGKRPKRQCVLRKNIDRIYSEALKQDPENDDGQSLKSIDDNNDVDDDDDDDDEWNPSGEFSSDGLNPIDGWNTNEMNSGKKVATNSSPRASTSASNVQLNKENEMPISNVFKQNLSNEYDCNKSGFNSCSEEQKVNNLTMWKQYTDVNERNRDFFIHITFGSRLPMYKKIVNHPYLMHCPLNSSGLPLIDDDLIKASGKLMVLDQMLTKLKERNHKILLFSTWTRILDILEDYLSLKTYLYVRLDGSTKIEKRKEYIDLFNNDPNVFLFLISTRAGGVGLNLAGADTVIIYDSDWNPQVDIQAMARCHRIGQTKPVAVYKFCTKGTIDEEIMKRADAKRKLEKMVISRKDIEPNLNKETLLKLKQLLESKDCQVVSTEKDVFTEEELEKLLDRSDLVLEPQASTSSDSELRKPLQSSRLENSQ